MLKKLCCAASLMLLVTTAQAELSLIVDTGAKTLQLMGSASGTPGTFQGGMPTMGWSIDQTSGSTNSVSVTDLVTTSGTSGFLGVYTDNGGGLTLGYTFGSLETVTASGDTVSYASLNATQESILESYIGDTLTLTSGSGYGDLSVTPVPEPAHYAAGLGVLSLGVIALRRRRARS